MYIDLTKGNIARSLIIFAIPMMLGNMLQQLYNVADTLVVGRVLGANALAAVGSAYTLMTFLTSIFLGLCMGSSALFSIYLGNSDHERLKSSIFQSFVLIIGITIIINIIVFIYLDQILKLLNVPDEVWNGLKIYLSIIFLGIIATSLYNFFACLLRSLGNSSIPLIFLAVSALLNVFLDILFVARFNMGIAGAAWATIISQYVSGIGIWIYVMRKAKDLIPSKRDMHFRSDILHEIIKLSTLTCLQQSVMNFGILMVQGLVNSFGTTVMAGFAAAVKIDTFAYLPVQDLGNAYSTFIAQNYGATNFERIRKGNKIAFSFDISFSIMISIIVLLFADKMMQIFIDPGEIAVIKCGVSYLRIVATFYFGIGCLFLFYGYFRAIKKAEISLILTIISLGTRVLLAYMLSGIIGETGIWVAIPIGWILADITGMILMFKMKQQNGDLS